MKASLMQIEGTSLDSSFGKSSNSLCDDHENERGLMHEKGQSVGGKNYTFQKEEWNGDYHSTFHFPSHKSPRPSPRSSKARTLVSRRPL